MCLTAVTLGFQKIARWSDRGYDLKLTRPISAAIRRGRRGCSAASASSLRHHASWRRYKITTEKASVFVTLLHDLGINTRARQEIKASGFPSASFATKTTSCAAASMTAEQPHKSARRPASWTPVRQLWWFCRALNTSGRRCRGRDRLFHCFC